MGDDASTIRSTSFDSCEWDPCTTVRVSVERLQEVWRRRWHGKGSGMVPWSVRFVPHGFPSAKLFSTHCRFSLAYMSSRLSHPPERAGRSLRLPHLKRKIGVGGVKDRKAKVPMTEGPNHSIKSTSFDLFVPIDRHPAHRQ